MSESTNILMSLKIIAQIRQHDKIATRGSTVRVDNNYLQCIRRFFTGENREINIMHVAEIFSQAFELLKLRKKENNIEAVQRLEIELLNARKGLLNLKTTYNGDSVSHARLDVIIDQLSRFDEKEEEEEVTSTI